MRRVRKGRPFDLRVTDSALGWLVEVSAYGRGLFRAALPRCDCGRAVDECPQGVWRRATPGRRFHPEQVGFYVAEVLHSYGFRASRRRKPAEVIDGVNAA